MRRLLRFALVGTLGFGVDAGVLTAALALGTGPWLGRIPAYLAAATVTFALNRAWTFADTPRDRAGRRWARFLAVNLVGFALNYGTYAALIATTPIVARNPVLGVAAGSLAGLAANFLLARALVFR